MKIAVLSSASGGGAGIAAYRIYEALSAIDGNVVDFFDSETIGNIDQKISPPISATNKKITNTHYTIDFATENRQWIIDLLNSYDIVNIQWSSYLISLSEILELAQLGKKILFTLHDFYYFTGGCHYPAGCLGYLNSCIACPQVDERLCNQLTVIKTLKLKRKLFSFSNVHLSAPSAFIVESAIRARIIPKNRAHILRNAYEPIHDSIAKHTNTNTNSLLLIADSFDEERKGLLLAVRAIKIAAKSLAISKNELEIHLVGGLDFEVLKLFEGTGVKIITHGHIKEHIKLVGIFEQCQFILSCSYEDNWPNILVESTSYGCIPIVGKWHGCEEFVKTLSIGLLAKDYLPTSFSDAIVEASAIPYEEKKRLASKIANKVRKLHSYICAARSYYAVLRKMLNTLECPKDEYSEKNDKIFSSNHISIIVRLQHEQSKIDGKKYYKTLVRYPTPFGIQEGKNFKKIKIDSLDNLYKEIHAYEKKGYGLSAFLID